MTTLLDEEASVFARLLVLSGLFGLAVGFLLEAYRLVLLDPVLGPGISPQWLSDARFMLLVSSLAVVGIAVVLDNLFFGYIDVVSGGALLGQWGIPLGLYLHATYGGASSIFSYLALVSGGLFALIIAVAAINYVRSWWLNDFLTTRVQKYWGR